MANIPWIFRYGPVASSTVFTSDVMSWSLFLGRRNYLDNYAGGRWSIVIKNQTNLAAQFVRGTLVRIENPDHSFQGGVVNSVQFDDYPGNTGLSTATVLVDDPMAQAGRFFMDGFTLYATALTTAQAVQTNTAYTGYNAPEITTYGTGQSTASGTASYTGTILNRLNLLQATERGQMWPNFANGINFISRNYADTPTVTFTRSTPGTNEIAYSDIRRVQAGDNFMNYVTISPEIAAGATATNSSSITSYGRTGYQVTTVDNTQTQASGLGSWLANMQSDPASFRFEIDVTTAAQSVNTYINDFLWNAQTGNGIANLVYRVPGASSDTTVVVVPEGIQVTGTPDQTRLTIYFSPATFYQYFTLNSSTLGILDTSRLGW